VPELFFFTEIINFAFIKLLHVSARSGHHQNKKKYVKGSLLHIITMFALWTEISSLNLRYGSCNCSDIHLTVALRSTLLSFYKTLYSFFRCWLQKFGVLKGGVRIFNLWDCIYNLNSSFLHSTCFVLKKNCPPFLRFSPWNDNCDVT